MRKSGIWPVSRCPDPFPRQRSEAEIRKDLASQIGAMIGKWEARLAADTAIIVEQEERWQRPRSRRKIHKLHLVSNA